MGKTLSSGVHLRITILNLDTTLVQSDFRYSKLVSLQVSLQLYHSQLMGKHFQC